MAKKSLVQPAPKSVQPRAWNGDLDHAFALCADMSGTDCFNAATLKLEQAERLLDATRLVVSDDDEPLELDPVIAAALALLTQSRIAFLAAYSRRA